MAAAATNSFSMAGLQPAFDPWGEAKRLAVKLPASVTYAKGTVLGEAIGVNAVKTLTITGTPTGGTFTVTYAAVTSGAIAFNATAAQVQTALEAVSTIGVNNVSVTGGPLPGTALTLTFQNALGKQVITGPTTTDSLTGGAAPASAVASVTTGVVGTPGTYKACVYTSTDGSQVPKALLEFDSATDASANITLGLQSGGGDKQQLAMGNCVPVFVSGTFNTGDLVQSGPGQITDAIAAQMGRLLEGTVVSGIIRLT